MPFIDRERSVMVAGEGMDAVADMTVFFVMNEYSTGLYCHFNIPFTNSLVANVALTVVEEVFWYAIAL